jgi:hypothetical protein
MRLEKMRVYQAAEQLVGEVDLLLPLAREKKQTQPSIWRIRLNRCFTTSAKGLGLLSRK